MEVHKMSFAPSRRLRAARSWLIGQEIPVPFGRPDMLVPNEIPDPVAGPGQVVVTVSAAHVLFIDTQLRQGWGSEYFNLQPPYIPGSGVAGTVRDVGAGVDATWISRCVVCDTSATGMGSAQRQQLWQQSRRLEQD
jgi:NADPH:quinone reductase-like Zn-dependent oxidoreductase